MARYSVTFNIEGKNPKTVAKAIADKLKLERDQVSVENLWGPQSRAERLSKAREQFDEAQYQVESLKGEMEDWYSNMPENFQNGSKGEEVQSAIDALDEILNNMENVSFDDVNFPGMY